MTALENLAYQLYNAKKSKLSVVWETWEVVPHEEKEAWRIAAQLAVDMILDHPEDYEAEE